MMKMKWKQRCPIKQKLRNAAKKSVEICLKNKNKQAKVNQKLAKENEIDQRKLFNNPML